MNKNVGLMYSYTSEPETIDIDKIFGKRVMEKFPNKMFFKFYMVEDMVQGTPKDNISTTDKGKINKIVTEFYNHFKESYGSNDTDILFKSGYFAICSIDSKKMYSISNTLIKELESEYFCEDFELIF